MRGERENKDSRGAEGPEAPTADAEAGRVIEDWLRAEGEIPLPEPSSALIPRTLSRVRDLILVGDLLRLVTLEALWKSWGRDSDDPGDS